MNCPGTAKQWVPSASNTQIDARPLPLVSGTACGKEMVNNIPPLCLRTGSRARETNTVQNKKLRWQNVLLACNRTDDEPYSFTLPAYSAAHRRRYHITLRRWALYIQFWLIVPGKGSIPPNADMSKSIYQQTPNSTLHSLSLYLLNLCAHLASIQVRSNMKRLS